MAADRVICIGCAMSRFFEPPFFRNYLVCDYSFNNVVGSPVYVPGPTASLCTTGTNPNYPGLCSVNEAVVSNL